MFVTIKHEINGFNELSHEAPLCNRFVQLDTTNTSNRITHSLIVISTLYYNYTRKHTHMHTDVRTENFKKPGAHRPSAPATGQHTPSLKTHIL